MAGSFFFVKIYSAVQIMHTAWLYKLDFYLHCIYYPACACASKGLCDRSWCLYKKKLHICKKISNFFLSFKILTFRHPFQHRKASLFSSNLIASRQLQKSSCPVQILSGFRVSIVRNTNIDQIETTPLRYCMLLDTIEHAYYTPGTAGL